MNDISRYQYYETSIYSVGVSKDYFKLIKRIQSSLNISPTVGNIIRLSPHEFQNTKGVGKKYVNELVSLQNILPELLDKFHSKSRNEDDSLLESEYVSGITYGKQKCFNDEFNTLYGNLELQIKEIQKLTFDYLLEHNKTETVDNINSELEIMNRSLQKIYSISINANNKLVIHNKIYINYYFIDSTEIKALKKA